MSITICGSLRVQIAPVCQDLFVLASSARNIKANSTDISNRCRHDHHDLIAGIDKFTPIRIRHEMDQEHVTDGASYSIERGIIVSVSYPSTRSIAGSVLAEESARTNIVPVCALRC